MSPEPSGVYSRFQHKAKDYGRRPKRWGAATARHYANMVHGVGGICIPRRGHQPNKTRLVFFENEPYFAFNQIPTKIQFIGLFDTVPSVIDLISGDTTTMNDDNGDVVVHLPSGIATEKVVQLAAINERRENFGLKSILSSPVTCKAPEVKTEGNHLEECMYGAHSDIGGGYVSGTSDTISLGSDEDAARQALDEGWISDPTSTNCKEVDRSISSGYLFDRETITEQCITEGETGQITETIKRIDNGLKTREVHDNTEMKRNYVDGRYARIALHKMHAYATENTVPFQSLDPEESQDNTAFLNDEIQVPDDLETITEKIFKSEPLSKEELKLLKKKYLHHSDNYAGIGHDRHESGERLIFPN